MFELRHLRYFIAVAEELHFGRAAQRLNIAQPGLSQQIQSLETDLGVSLLARTNRHVQLTPAGLAFLDEARRVLAQVDRAVNLVKRAASGQIGRLSIGATESATWVLLPELIRQFRSRFPSVDLAIREMPSPSQLAALRAGDIDVGFVRPPIDTEGLVTRTVLKERLGLLLPEAHPLAKRSRLPLTALAGQPLIIHPARPSGWSDFMISVCREAGIEPQVSQDALETGTAVSFVAAGLGLTIVPESLKVLVRPGVVYRPVSGPVPRARLLLVHRNGPLTPTLTALLHLAQHLWPELK